MEGRQAVASACRWRVHHCDQAASHNTRERIPGTAGDDRGAGPGRRALGLRKRHPFRHERKDLGVAIAWCPSLHGRLDGAAPRRCRSQLFLRCERYTGRWRRRLMAKITIKDLRQSYYPNPQRDEDWALKKLTLDLADGGAFALLGPSGCGKTTLLNLVSGLLKPTEGRIYFDDADVTDTTPEQRNIAQVFQFPVIYDT